jgi:ubiquinone/menaquinone biosynthesis C-methylase UbiE
LIEIGAGTGEHALHVKHRYNEYVLTDTDDKTLAIAKSKLDHLTTNDKLSYVTVNGSTLPYEDGAFDRLIATHVLEHIPQPHLTLKEWRRVVRDGGSISILIPTDPGLAWRLGRMMGPRRNAISKGIAYDYVMAREHVNSCTNLLALIRHYFSDRNEMWWPLRIPSVDLNLLFACNICVHK